LEKLFLGLNIATEVHRGLKYSEIFDQTERFVNHESIEDAFMSVFVLMGYGIGNLVDGNQINTEEIMNLFLHRNLRSKPKWFIFQVTLILFYKVNFQLHG